MPTEVTTGGESALVWNSPSCPPQERTIPERKRRRKGNEKMRIFVFFITISDEFIKSPIQPVLITPLKKRIR
jgi:hypothetical protein